MLIKILPLKGLLSQSPSDNNADKLIFLRMNLSCTVYFKTLHIYKVVRSKQSPSNKTISG